MVKIDNLDPWYGICIRTEGITPLFVNYKDNRAMFGLVSTPNHHMEMRVDAYDIDGNLISSEKPLEPLEGNIKLQLDYNNGMPRKVVRNDTWVEQPTEADRMLGISYYTPDLESFYNGELPKDFSLVTARLYLYEGLVSTYKLMFENGQPVAAVFRSEGGGAFDRPFNYLSASIGIRVDFQAQPQTAKLTWQDRKDIYNFLSVPNGYFFLITLKNNCETEDTDDFMRIYDVVSLNSATLKIRPYKVGMLASERTVFCAPVTLTRSQIF